MNWKLKIVMLFFAATGSVKILSMIGEPQSVWLMTLIGVM